MKRQRSGQGVVWGRRLVVAVLIIAIGVLIASVATGHVKSARTTGRAKVYHGEKGGNNVDVKNLNVVQTIKHTKHYIYVEIGEEGEDREEDETPAANLVKVTVTANPAGGFTGTAHTFAVPATGTLSHSEGNACTEGDPPPAPGYACARALTWTKVKHWNIPGGGTRIRKFRWDTKPNLRVASGNDKYHRAYYRSEDPVQFVGENPGLPDTLASALELVGIEMVGLASRQINAGTDLPDYEFLYNLGISYMNDSTSVDVEFSSNPLCGLADGAIEAALRDAFVITVVDSAAGTFMASLDSIYLFELFVPVPAAVDSVEVSATDIAFCESPPAEPVPTEPATWGRVKALYR